MQALPLASFGNKSMISGLNSASMHQQSPGAIPLARVFSIAQSFGARQMGQQVGSMKFIGNSVSA
jgi:hypothetical protein